MRFESFSLESLFHDSKDLKNYERIEQAVDTNLVKLREKVELKRVLYLRQYLCPRKRNLSFKDW